MLRKSMAALLAAAMVMSALTGCSGSNDSADPVKEPQNPAEEAGPGEQQRAGNKRPLSRGQPAAYGL